VGQPYRRIDRVHIVKQGKVLKMRPTPWGTSIVFHQVFGFLNYIAFDDLEDRVDISERFFIYLFLSPIDDLFPGFFPGRQQVLNNERLVRELVEILIGELRGLRLTLVYLLGLGVFFTFLEFRRI
jgi:hypothetical protein